MTHDRAYTWLMLVPALILALGLAGDAPQQSPASTTPAADLPPALPASAAREPTLERLQWAREVDGDSPITALEIRNDFGDIRARKAGDRRLEAWMVVQRLDPHGERVGFTVERRGSVVALAVAYPPGRVRDTEPQAPKNSYDRLDLVVYLPPGVALRASTLRGEIEVRRLESDVDVSTLEGAIHVRTTGAVRIRTAGGSASALIAAAALAAAGPPLIVESDSGPLRVVLPRGAEPELRVETSGKISTPLALRLSTAAGRTRGLLGPASARRLLLVTSGSGDVTIERE